jgi:hypothetical protein
MRNHIIAAALLATLAGCSGVQLVCTENERQLIESENARLIERRKEIESWEAGKAAPGMVYSMLTKADVISESKRGYNIAFDRLAAHSQQFNLHCGKR